MIMPKAFNLVHDIVLECLFGYLVPSFWGHVTRIKDWNLKQWSPKIVFGFLVLTTLE